MGMLREFFAGITAPARRRCVIIGAVTAGVAIFVVVSVIAVVSGKEKEESCEKIGCVLSEGECYFPQNSTKLGYKTTSVLHDGSLILSWTGPLIHPKVIPELLVQVETISNEISRVVIKDAKQDRYEIPIPLKRDTWSKIDPDLVIETSGVGEMFWMTVTRKSTNTILFDTRDSVLVFMDQFLEITSKLPSNRLYGFAERGAPFRRSMDNITMPLFAHDNFPSPIGQDINLYSSQPFYMMAESDGSAHGVLIYNSNAMEAHLKPIPSVTVRAMGGILDLYFLAGPSPIAVTEQLTDLIGKPFLPPYWSLGFHLCRYGYKNLTETRETFLRNWDRQLPMDVQWQDIDYMDQKLIFTIDPGNYKGLGEFVRKEVQTKGVHYVIIVDPGIGRTEGFGVFERGKLKDVYIKTSQGEDLVGKVWPGPAVFPDFTNPITAEWWKDEMIEFHDQLPSDGIWLDMNELANFDENGNHGSIHGCEDNEINHPPYKPCTSGPTLYYKTICLDAKQKWGIQRDLHNIYGLTETIATHGALTELFPEKRPFIISRSTFPGSGQYGGHWLGDNESSWKHLRQSIMGILDFNLVGIPMTGADIGGFMGEPTEELAIRWHQLGAWYPFCRNHNMIGSPDQDPGVYGEEVFGKIKRALEIRYDLLPYWYTRFVLANQKGTPIIRATFQNYPNDKTAAAENFDEEYTQFLVGDSILVAPVVTEGEEEVKVYLPADDDWFIHRNDTYTLIGNGLQLIAAPLDELPYFVKAGSILFLQREGQTTVDRRKSNLELHVLPNAEKEATGFMYLDDGETTDTAYHTIRATLTQRSLKLETFSFDKSAGDISLPKVSKVEVANVDSDTIESEVVCGTANATASIESGTLTIVFGESASLFGLIFTVSCVLAQEKVLNSKLFLRLMPIGVGVSEFKKKRQKLSGLARR
eukprot:sb/3479756/